MDVADFGAGEPDFPTPDNIKQAAMRAIEQNFTKYTAAGGIMELKQAICERHTADFGTSYKPANCLVTVGGKHVIFNLTQVLVNPGDEVIIPVPYWVTYKDVVNYAGGKCVFVPTDEANGFALNAAAIEPYITVAHQDDHHQFAVEPQRRGAFARRFRGDLQTDFAPRHLPDDG